MKAVILAAGKGTRLEPITLNKPKCLIDVDGRTIIDRLVDNIRDAGISDILFVLGHQKEMIMDHFGNSVQYREYADYAKTNNFYTLWSIKDELDGDFMCFFSDVFMDADVLEEAKNSQEDACLIVDTKQVLDGTMRVYIEGDKVLKIGNHPVEGAAGNFTGIAKFSKKGAEKLFQQMAKMIPGHQQDYYTVALEALAEEGEKIGYIDIHGKWWSEVDTLEDLQNAESQLAKR